MPDPTLPMPVARLRLRQFRSATLEPGLGKFLFNSHPAQRIAVVAARQGPHGVPVIRQQDNRHNFERMIVLHVLDGLAEDRSSQLSCQNWRSPVRHAGKKVRPTGNVVSSIVGHICRSLQALWWACARWESVDL